MSTSGTSTPSLKMSTEKMNLTSPVESRSLALRRSSLWVSAVSARERIPACSNLSAMNLACALLTQKPRP